MTTSSNSSSSSTDQGNGLPANGGVNPWWTNWQKWNDDQRSIYRSILQKNFDLVPDDGMNFQANRSGIGTLGAIGIALAAGIPSAGISYMALSALSDLKESSPVAPPAAVVPADLPDVERAFRVKFYDADRNPITVRPLPDDRQE